MNANNEVFTGFIAADYDNLVWGHGTTRDECKADACEWRDNDLSGLTLYPATAAALAAVTERGADASTDIAFERDGCWLETE